MGVRQNKREGCVWEKEIERERERERERDRREREKETERERDNIYANIDKQIWNQ